MTQSYPEWATDKQIEGMQLFNNVLNEYLWEASVEFKETDFADEDSTRFYAVVFWDSGDKGKRQHEFDIAFDYEAEWDYLGERIHRWQFLFAGGEASRELTNEILFMDLFWYLDKVAVTATASDSEHPCVSCEHNSNCDTAN